jgi:uncharacterized protein (DUF305 family)
MLALSFVSMYVLMYAMVDIFPNAFANLNQGYMAGLMTVPMAAIEILVMRGMYPNAKLNTTILAVSLLAFVSLFFLIRRQVGISDREFLRSMIPHHGGAVLMCERAPIADPEIEELCSRIISSQQAEIAEMKDKLEELEH